MTSHQKRIIVITQAKTLTANQYKFRTLYGFKYNLLGASNVHAQDITSK